MYVCALITDTLLYPAHFPTFEKDGLLKQSFPASPLSHIALIHHDHARNRTPTDRTHPGPLLLKLPVLIHLVRNRGCSLRGLVLIHHDLARHRACASSFRDLVLIHLARNRNCSFRDLLSFGLMLQLSVLIHLVRNRNYNRGRLSFDFMLALPVVPPLVRSRGLWHKDLTHLDLPRLLLELPVPRPPVDPDDHGFSV